MTSAAQDRIACFRADYQLWVVVRHFLSADLMEELARALVVEAGAGRFRFSELCDVQRSIGPALLRSWSVRSKRDSSGLRGFLQRAVRALAWQSDQPVGLYSDADKAATPEAETMRAVELAFSLAHADLASFRQLRPREPEETPVSLKVIFELLEELTKDDTTSIDQLIARIDQTLSSIALPLRGVIYKHLGDLCAIEDDPGSALALYFRSEAALKDYDAKHWDTLLTSLRAMLIQSRAAMLRLAEGPEAAAKVLDAELARRARLDSLLVANGAADAMEATSLSGDRRSHFRDIRAAFLVTPLLAQAHHLESALELWSNKRFPEAHHRFWTVLRRQIALGAARASSYTKAYYGRSLVDELAGQLAKHRSPESFEVAVRLLVECGRPEIVHTVSWPPELLAVYVNANTVEAAIRFALRAPGVQDERQQALSALCGDWLLHLSPDSDVAASLLEYLAEQARTAPWSSRDAARVSFEALTKVANQRPDFRRVASGSVTDAIVARIEEDNFRSQMAALDAAVAFGPGLTNDDLKRCLRAALDRLAQTEPSGGAWPVVQPAIELIVSQRAQTLWRDDHELGVRCAATVLRFGLGSERDLPSLLMTLKDLAPYVVLSSEDGEKLQEMVLQLRKKAHQINSSGATTDILALLSAPTIAGVEGISDAVGAIADILRSATSAHPSIVLAVAYQPLILLYQEQARIVAELGLTEHDFLQLMSSLIEPLEKFWGAAANNPLLFAPFAIPLPTAPSSVVVHNWTFATLGFARAVKSEARLEAAMEPAERNPELRESMAVARAVQSTTETSLDQTAIRTEPRAAFYPSLGQRLAVLSGMSKADRSTLLDALLRQCFRNGPNGLDAGVISLALSDGLSCPDDSAVLELYLQRLEKDRTLRLGLAPLVQAFIRNP